MNVKDIKNPTFLKGLSTTECIQLAEDIRSFLIDNISKTGGHLSSNLGIVELTIALHKVFDSPKDKIFFDVGHQSYIHKILTGRAEQFSSLRQYNGLSGFQKRNESEHDVWEAGHSSTSLSAAMGMAIARDLNHETYQVIPVVGDGSLFNGMSFEALNHIGFEQKNMIIIFNDNNMSISQNIGGLSKGLNKLRTSSPYTQIKGDMKEALNTTKFGHQVLNSMTSLKNTLKHGVVDAGVFGEFDLEYIGPVDGHDIKELVRVLEVAKEHEGPIVVHVLTKKGKGYSFCENDVSGKWHGTPPFNP
ncbi:MAG: 1-deoxy-D-xylulose-5-phosphate synthase N-terminal domain-containing protein, partial [Erysipelotrichaceae bacterium]